MGRNRARVDQPGVRHHQRAWTCGDAAGGNRREMGLDGDRELYFRSRVPAAGNCSAPHVGHPTGIVAFGALHTRTGHRGTETRRPKVLLCVSVSLWLVASEVVRIASRFMSTALTIADVERIAALAQL